MTSSTFLSVAVGLLLFILLERWTRGPSIAKDRGLRELPGPKAISATDTVVNETGYPIIGNLLDIPKIHAFLSFYNLSKTYGPIYKLSILGTTHVIISSQRVADDLMARRGAIYSDRGSLHMVRLVTGGGNLLAASSQEDALGPGGKKDGGGYWRRGRRFTAAMLAPVRAVVWEPTQERMAMKMVLDMVLDPRRYAYWFDRYAASVGLREVYGLVPGSEEEVEYHTKKIAKRMHEIERIATPGGYLVELIPALMKVPETLAPFKREARALHKIESEYFRQLLQGARDRLAANVEESPPSFARILLSEPQKWQLSQAETTYLLGTLYGGGSGTTANAMQSFVLTVCHYPEWQRKMQEEVDSVVGPSRLPGFVDIPRLPVVRAVVKEVLRWRPVTAGNVPHRLTRDDSHEGYHIPKGAFIHGNQWAIHRDEELYPDPEDFNPARYLEKGYPTYKEDLETYPNIKRFSAFGFGRRICPGLETGERSLYIQVALLAWACHIGKKVDEDGKEIHVPWFDYTTGVNVMPSEFEFSLVERGRGRMDLIRKTLANF